MGKSATALSDNGWIAMRTMAFNTWYKPGFCGCETSGLSAGCMVLFFSTFGTGFIPCGYYPRLIHWFHHKVPEISG